MRLGCEATAIDINPVAWFVLKCTLDYPHKFAGKLMPLPEFVRTDREFLEAWFGREIDSKKPSKKRVHQKVDQVLSGQESTDPDLWDADLSWHVRAWGRWVLSQARTELAHLYPTYAEWQPTHGWGERTPTAPPLEESAAVATEPARSA
jgi:adenine-specific DNA methylase